MGCQLSNRVFPWTQRVRQRGHSHRDVGDRAAATAIAGAAGLALAVHTLAA